MKIHFVKGRLGTKIHECEIFPINTGDFVVIHKVIYRVKTKIYHMAEGILEIEVKKVGDY